MTIRIGLINEYFPPFAPGGAEWSSLALAQALAQDHSVRVLTPNYGTADRETMGNAQVLRFPSPVKLDGSKMTVPIRWLANPGYYRRVMQAIVQAAVHEPFDLLHVQAKYSLPGAYWAARRLGIPIAYTIRDSLIVCPTGQCLIEYDPIHKGCGTMPFWWRLCRPLYMGRYMHGVARPWRIQLALLWQQFHIRLFRSALKRVDGVIGVSEGILDVYRQAGLQLGQKTAVIYNLPPTKPSNYDVTAVKAKFALKNEPIVLYAGKFSLGKGTQILVKAADQLIQKKASIQFLFAGHGDIQLNGPHTRNLGRLSHDELQALYQLADMVIIPSTWPEPLSRVGLEAMAAGKPLIGTRVGGTPEQIIDGKTGYIVPRKDPSALAEAILRLLADEALRQEMGQQAKELVETKFSATASLHRMIHFYEHLLNEHK